ncbi:hypothetical protein BG004_007908, partial [Podila humilis]
MNPYDSSAYSQPGGTGPGTTQPPHHQQQQSGGQGGYYNPSQQYNPNAYQPQQQKQQQQQQQQSYNSSHHHQYQQQARSPPPLQHPVPTRPPVQMRESAATPSPRMNYAQTTTTTTATSSQGYINNNNQYNPNQYQQPQQQQQQQFFGGNGSSGGAPQGNYVQGHMQQPGQQQQQPGQQGQQNSGMPAFPFNLNDGTTQLGMQFGRSAVMAGQEYVEQNLNRWVNKAALQPYFNVIMAFVTYILLVGIAEGTKGGFKPEMLGLTASSSFAVVILEFVMIKLFVYLLNIASDAPLLDLIAYSGYKFVG